MTVRRADTTTLRRADTWSTIGFIGASRKRYAMGSSDGTPVVLTAPLTETIDHAGFFIQMAMASMPVWLERVLDRKYPNWRSVQRNEDGSARYMPAGVRLVEAALLREFPPEDIVCCYPDDLGRFIGPRTRVVGVSTHNPLGVTFAAGVYASMFGSSKLPLNAHYARQMFAAIGASPYRRGFRVIVGGSGGWQIAETNSFEELGVDCVVDGRSESAETMTLFRQAIAGEALPRRVFVGHPTDAAALLVPERRTTFGVVEMTTGCGRRCRFCVPDLSPQLDFPKEKIMAAVRANVREGNKQISLATEDMFVWGHAQAQTPFYFPNHEALVDLYGSIAETPGVEEVLLSHCTIAPAVVDPLLIRHLSDVLLAKSPVKVPAVSTHPERRILSPLVGLETGSVRMARQVMPGKSAPFPIDEWPSVVLEGLRIFNENNWFPVMTLLVGAPGETDDDVMATLDLVYEIERRGLFGFLVPSVFTPLHDTRMADMEGVTETQQLSRLQWQLIMKCWKFNMRPGLQSWWGPIVWRTGALGLWAAKLRKTNGPRFTWPLLMFASALPETMMASLGKIYGGKPLETKTRRELLATVRPGQRRYLREDNGDLPDGWPPHRPLPLAAVEG
jgi:radical SAM superfamily enzyme YgiQ (UPF0313 family)